jgi:hypothetical protein
MNAPDIERCEAGLCSSALEPVLHKPMVLAVLNSQPLAELERVPQVIDEPVLEQVDSVHQYHWLIQGLPIGVTRPFPLYSSTPLVFPALFLM